MSALFCPIQLLAQATDSAQIRPGPALEQSTGRKLATLQVNVDVVLVPITVTDNENRPVMGLQKENFVLFDGGREQQIRFFASEDTPLSIGLILDVSNSMRSRIDVEREAVAEFFKNAHPDDEYFAIAVSNRPVLLADTTRNIGKIQNRLATVQPSGYTALMDAIYYAIERMQSAKYSRRAILIISDGGDNDSRYKFREIKRVAAEADVLIYAIRPMEAMPLFRTIEERVGGRVLAGITEITGGRTVSLMANQDIPAVAAQISRELRSQYVLGFQPSEGARNPKRGQIKVVARRPSASAPLQVRYKKVYSTAVR